MTLALAIAVVAGAVRLTVPVPAVGEWTVFSTVPGSNAWRVEASGRANEPCHVAVTVRCGGETCRVYFARLTERKP